MRTARLEDVCEISMGQAPAGRSYNDTGGGVPLIAGAGDFSCGKIRVKKYTTAPSRISKPGDIILGIRATIGVKAWADDVYCLGRGVAGLRPKSDLDANYLWHWLSRARNELQRKARGATFMQVNRTDIGELEVPLPPIEEQRRIAAVLDQADEFRAKRTASFSLLDSLSAAITTSAVIDEPPMRLEDGLAFLTSGARGWAKHYADCGSRFIRSLDVRMGSIGEKAPVYVSPPETAEARRIRVRAGDILLTITGSLIGRVSVAPPALRGAYVSQHVAILRLDQDVLLPEFVAAYLALPTGGQRQIAASFYGQTKPGLNFEQIRAFDIPALSVPTQKSLVHKLEHVASLRRRAGDADALTDELFAALQRRALSGQL